LIINCLEAQKFMNFYAKIISYPSPHGKVDHTLFLVMCLNLVPSSFRLWLITLVN
jgi:hypothetical protein